MKKEKPCSEHIRILLEKYVNSLTRKSRMTKKGYRRYARMFLEYLDNEGIPFENAGEKDVKDFAGDNRYLREGAFRFLRFFRPDDFAYLDEVKQEALHPGLAELLERYMKNRVAEGASDRELIITRSYLRRFLEFLEQKGIMEIRQITKAEISDYSMHIFLYRFKRKPVSKKGDEPRPYSPATRAQILIKIRNFLKYFKRLGEVLGDPAGDVPLPKIPASINREVPGIAEIDKILAAVDREKKAGLRNYAMIETLYGTGLRSPELVKLKLDDIDFEGRFIIVRKGKYGNPRTVPASDSVLSALKEYIVVSRPVLAARQEEDDGSVFLSVLDGTRLTTQTVVTVIEKCAAKAGVKKHLIPHSLRYACATHMMKNGADIRFIQEMLGHESLLTTQGYTKVVKGDLKRVVRQCHPRELDWEEAKPQGGNYEMDTGSDERKVSGQA